MLPRNLVSTFYLSALIGVACSGSNATTGSGGNGGSARSSGGTTGTAGGTAGTTGMAGGSAGTTGTAGSTAGTTGAGGNGGSAGGSPGTPILDSLSTISTIGSTIDPSNNPAIDPTGSSTNPYGLVIAPISAGLITTGDLVVCNFNNGPNMVQGSPMPNTQGQGTTVVGLHPVASANVGGNPYHIAQSASLLGCSSLSMFADDSIAATAFSAGIVPLVAPTGSRQLSFCRRQPREAMGFSLRPFRQWSASRAVRLDCRRFDQSHHPGQHEQQRRSDRLRPSRHRLLRLRNCPGQYRFVARPFRPDP